MEIRCVVKFPGGAGEEARRFFTEKGWQDEGGAFAVSVPAALGGVDAPSIEIYKKIMGICVKEGPAAGRRSPGSLIPEGGAVEAAPVTVRLSAGGREMFFADAVFGRVGEEQGVRLNVENPPYFTDLLRLRDKAIATLTALARGE